MLCHGRPRKKDVVTVCANPVVSVYPTVSARSVQFRNTKPNDEVASVELAVRVEDDFIVTNMQLSNTQIFLPKI